LNAAGIPWKNYQEDVQFAVSAIHSASDKPHIHQSLLWHGQFNLRGEAQPDGVLCRHAAQNVYPLAQLFHDLNNNSVGLYNWITPNQFNDAHSALSGGFTYQGTHYTGDQAGIAQGDNFLSIVVPQIMTSPAYQNNGLIIIWWDETEGGDDASRDPRIRHLAAGQGQWLCQLRCSAILPTSKRWKKSSVSRRSIIPFRRAKPTTSAVSTTSRL
jgi:hypothetical protein